MQELAIKTYVRYFFGISILFFVSNKLWIRPWILARDVPDFIKVFVLSVPNFIEAIVGTIVVTGLLFRAQQYFNKQLGKYKATHVYLTAVSIAACYVLTQEYKIHNLGGNNVFDIYDVIASILGLVVTFGVIYKYGFLDKD
ncbi:MAG: hypothetical protein MI974_32435 [Chitinophagales bacterium]|nr:hypothetical protein [Chitinophagales bacterium]